LCWQRPLSGKDDFLDTDKTDIAKQNKKEGKMEYGGREHIFSSSGCEDGFVEGGGSMERYGNK